MMQTLNAPKSHNLIFYCGLALLCTHELDAVAKQEWRLLPFLSQMTDQDGFFWFVMLHIPLFTLIFWLTAHPQQRLARLSRLGVSLFLVIHGLLHFALSGSADYAFTPPIETITVYGGALTGLIYSALSLAGRARKRD